MIALACSSGGTDERQGFAGAGGTGAVQSGTGGSSPGGSPGTGGLVGVGATDAGLGGGGASNECATLREENQLEKRPIDIVFIIDNSGSMGGEIRQVEERINADLVQIVEGSGADYRVIMVSRFGSSTGQSICIRAPLGADDCSDLTAPKNNPPRFFHYSLAISSHDALCKLLQSYRVADSFGLAPGGWSEHLRLGSFKMFVAITDDDASCVPFNDQGTEAGGMAVADDFDSRLTGFDPAQFEDDGERNYRFFSIVGMSANVPPTEPWAPSQPIQTGRCTPGSKGPGTGYQGLSVLTGGLRWPSCNNDDFNAIFQAIADGVVRASGVSCTLDIPDPPPGEVFDPNEVNVQIFEASGNPEDVLFVEDPADCGSAGGWTYDDNAAPTQINLCPSTCDSINQADSTRVEVTLGCATLVRPPQ